MTNDTTPVQLRLYIVDSTSRSATAVARIHEVCAELFGDDFSLEIIDVLEDPARAEADRILTTPTLMKIQPGRTSRIIGDLSDAEALARALAPLGSRSPGPRTHRPGDDA